jgi:hypothetical protein
MSESSRVEFPFFVGNSAALKAWARFRDLVLDSRPLTDLPPTASRTRSEPGASSATASLLGAFAVDSPATDRAFPPAGHSAAASPFRDGGVWRLLAANNREIARCTRLFPAFEVARDDVLVLREHADDFNITQVLGPQRGMRGWYVSLGGEAVLTCSRWYEAASSSLDAASDAVESFRAAHVADAARTMGVGRRGVRPATPATDPGDVALRVSGQAATVTA